MAVGSPVAQIVSVPFLQEPCRCVAQHAPAPPYAHLHHIWPLGLGGPDVRDNLVPLCPSGHDRVHWAMHRFDRAGKVIPLQMNRYLWQLAVTGWELAHRD